jgi:hypothetical protein
MNALPAIINAATARTVHRREKSTRGAGQNLRIGESNGAWRGRYLIDFPGGLEGQKRSVVPGIRNKQNPGKMLQFDPVDPRVEAAA